MAARFSIAPITANGEHEFPLPYAGELQFTGLGDFDGGTMVAEVSPDDGESWIPLPGASWTAPFIDTLKVGNGCAVRFKLSDAINPNITLRASHIAGGVAYKI